MLGGMNKMFELNDEKTPQKLAQEMMAGAVRGILEHFEFKMDDLKRDVERKSEEIGKLKQQIEDFEEKEKSSKTTQNLKNRFLLIIINVKFNFSYGKTHEGNLRFPTRVLRRI